MFKHVIRKEPSEGSSSGSDREDLLSDAGDDVALGSDVEGGDAGLGETIAMAEEEAAFWDENDEELPENLPSLEEAYENPVFELETDAKGRKTLICVFCPDKVLREGKMKEVHLDSSSHKRRATRYAEHLKKTPDMSEETADPRRVSAFLDMQLRLRKSGGAGFTINPNPAKRKRKRNKKKTPEERAAAAARAIANGAEPKDGEDGIAVVSGLTAMNAKQKRKQRQNENKAKSKEGEVSSDNGTPEAKPAPTKAANSKSKLESGASKSKKPRVNGSLAPRRKDSAA